MEQFEQFLEGMRVGEQADYKVGLTTYTFYRASGKDFEVSHTRDGWSETKFMLHEVAGESPMEYLNSLKWY